MEPWRLQELADTECHYDGSDSGPTYGRRYAVFYNQVAVGIVEISVFGRYDAEKKPIVWTYVEVKHARLLPFFSVVGFLDSLAANTAGATKNELEETKRTIDRALLAVVWNTNPSRDDDDGTVEIKWSGSAENYLVWRKQFDAS